MLSYGRTLQVSDHRALLSKSTPKYYARRLYLCGSVEESVEENEDWNVGVKLTLMYSFVFF